MFENGSTGRSSTCPRQLEVRPCSACWCWSWSGARIRYPACRLSNSRKRNELAHPQKYKLSAGGRWLLTRTAASPTSSRQSITGWECTAGRHIVRRKTNRADPGRGRSYARDCHSPASLSRWFGLAAAAAARLRGLAAAGREGGWCVGRWWNNGEQTCSTRQEGWRTVGGSRKSGREYASFCVASVVDCLSARLQKRSGSGWRVGRGERARNRSFAVLPHWTRANTTLQGRRCLHPTAAWAF